jgi:hypothetical protein
MLIRLMTLAATVLLAGCGKKDAIDPISMWESPPNAVRHVQLTLYPKKCLIEYGNVQIDVVTRVRGSTLVWIAEPDEHGRPQEGTSEVPFADVQKDGSLVMRLVPALFDDSRLAPYILQNKPIQPQVPTRGNGK